MAGFQPAIKIIDAIEKIKSNEYLLPAFQREYVWDCEQIERLFDSLMRGYPISSMLFWKVKGENKSRWQFYKFLDKYREEYYTHNNKMDTARCNDFYAILDGQQRLTSIYIALCGNYDTHKKYAKWENVDNNFEIRDFYFNLTCSQKTKNSDIEYEFLWLDRSKTQEEIIYIDEFKQKWFKCKHILKIEEAFNLMQFLKSQGDSLTEKETKNLSDFHTLVFGTKDNTKINYYLEEDDDPDKAVNIFIRINSGGTHLDYSDILFSYAIVNWQKKDARTEINRLVDYINQNLGFSITKDLILKAFLFLHHNTIKFQINSFDNGFIKAIENCWDKIKDSVLRSYELLKTFGLNKNTLTSNNAVLPIIYYIYHKNLSPKILDTVSLEEERNTIKKYILRAIILKPFGGSADAVLASVRKVFKEDFDNEKFFDSEISLFPVQEIEKKYRYGLNIDNDYLEELMLCRKDSAEAFAILSLLYPNLDTKNNNFHKDHLHPVNSYSEYENYMKKQNIEYYDFKIYDSLPNLQLLSSNENESKSNKSLNEWVKKECKDKSDIFKVSFLRDHLIPDVNLDLENFEEFFERRKELLIAKLKEIL